MGALVIRASSRISLQMTEAMNAAAFFKRVRYNPSMQPHHARHKRGYDVQINAQKQTAASSRRSARYPARREHGHPYTIPLNYLYVEADEPEALGKVYFHSAKAGHKIDAIERDPKASFCVIADDTVLPDKYSTAYKSVIAFGTVHLIEGDLAHKALFDLGDKYNPHHEDRTLEEVNSAEDRCAMIEFTIEHLTGKESHSYRKQREQQE